MSVTITPYQPSDQEEVKEVVLNGFKEFGFSYHAQYDSDLDDPSIYLKDGGIFYVLKYKGKIIGTTGIINKGSKIAELKRMYVDKNYQGRGYGSMLFDQAIKFCKENGFIKLEFETNKKFKEAHTFYQKRGCKIVREDERSYYMEKLLD